MKKMYFVILLSSLFLASCGGTKTTRPVPAPPAASKPVPPPAATVPAVEPGTAASDVPSKPGGYYLDDGPEANPPTNLDSIPDAQPKNEPLLPRSNKPYVALGQTYKPMATTQTYKMRGIASWYGKRFHGKKTSSGETYDMYAMTAAHTVLPLPSYAKVTNLANGRSVVVRINDRGPFKKDRIIDLSYAAAYKLRLLAQGSGLVEVEAVNQGRQNDVNVPAVAAKEEVRPGFTGQSTIVPAGEINGSEKSAAIIAITSPSEAVTEASQTPPPTTTSTVATPQMEMSTTEPTENPTNAADVQNYFVQAGAFKNEANAENLMKRIQELDIAQNVGINRVYNNALHRLKLGPFSAKLEAEQLAVKLRKQLNIPVIILNQ